MLDYYQYWERWIFKAISIMILRAFAAIKTIFTQTSKWKLLIKISAEYSNPDITYLPSAQEIENQLDKFIKNALESAKSFGWWWKGFCRVFDEVTNSETAEKYIPYTFFEDIN